jgi:DNA-binding transcriptional regulator of glucitol operon
MSPLLLLGAVVAGWIVQMLLTYRQSNTFNRAVRELRTHGTVAVGAGGRRYRGGKAFVAIATDSGDRVTKAISLSGWTTFARPTDLPQVVGLTVSRLRRDAPIDSVAEPHRLALREAAEAVRKKTAASLS